MEVHYGIFKSKTFYKLQIWKFEETSDFEKLIINFVLNEIEMVS